MLYQKGFPEYSLLRIFAYLVFFSFITNLTSAFAENPKQEVLEKYRAEAYQEQQKGNFESALEAYTKAISLGLESPVVYNDMGVLYEQLGINHRAEQFYLKALQIDPNYLPAHSNLAYLYLKVGLEDKAFQYFESRYQKGDPDDSWTQRAKEEMYRIRPELRDRIFLKDVRDLQQDVVRDIRKDFYEKIVRSREYYKRGKDFFEEGKYEDAIREYNRALRLTPGDRRVARERKKAIIQYTKRNIEMEAQEAIEMMESGDSISAKRKIQNILTTIPNEPIYVSK